MIAFVLGAIILLAILAMAGYLVVEIGSLAESNKGRIEALERGETDVGKPDKV